MDYLNAVLPHTCIMQATNGAALQRMESARHGQFQDKEKTPVLN